jgi:ABC-2 type transport system permease protein
MMVALFSLSFYIPLLCTLDKEASLFGNELRIGVSRNKLFVSKYFFILGLVGFIEGLSFTTFASLQFFLSNRTLDFYLICFFLLAIFISLMPMVLSYLFLTLVLNESGSLIFGVLFTLSGILLGTTALGSKLWYVIPWTWGFRLVYKIIPKEILQGDFKNYWQIISESLLTSVLFLLLELFWYNRWEGVSKLEE